MVAIDYRSGRQYDATLPHRIFDAHVRGASEDGTPVVQADWYHAIRDARFADLSPVFTTSPVTLAFGGWDSTRKQGQFRLRSHFVSELFAVVAEAEDRLSRRSGGRLDPLGQDFHVTPDEFEALLDRQAPNMSEKKVEKLRQEITKARKTKGATLSASHLGLGGVPPGTETPYGVSVPEVLRSRTYSLAGLRRLRFGGSKEEDVAARAALLAMMLLGAAYADADPAIRAYCDLTSPSGQLFLDDERVDLDLSIEACEEWLAEAISELPERLGWNGGLIELEGDPALDRAATSDDEG
jgi:CRISPR-associated protein Csb1